MCIDTKGVKFWPQKVKIPILAKELRAHVEIFLPKNGTVKHVYRASKYQFSTHNLISLDPCPPMLMNKIWVG